MNDDFCNHSLRRDLKCFKDEDVDLINGVILYLGFL